VGLKLSDLSEINFKIINITPICRDKFRNRNKPFRFIFRLNSKTEASRIYMSKIKKITRKISLLAFSSDKIEQFLSWAICKNPFLKFLITNKMRLTKPIKRIAIYI
jgi:hypothetical protein